MDTKDWSSGELWTYAITTYLIVLGFMLATGLALCNLAQFIIIRSTDERHSKKCCLDLNHPMLAFYVWILLDFVSNIFWLFVAVKSNENPMPLAVYLPATCKVMVGTEQIWLMLELIVQIDKATVLL